MKTLYLVRHAKSSWEADQISDYYRPLKTSGIKDAIQVSRFVRENYFIKPDVIFSSPAARAINTAVIFVRELGLNLEEIELKETIYESSKEELLKLVRNLEDRFDSALLFGHDHSISAFINYLSDLNLDKLPTSGIVALDLKIESWKQLDQAKGLKIFTVFPKSIRTF